MKAPVAVPVARPRQQTIFELARERGQVGVAELAGRFRVTPMTVRRDLDHLAGQGLLIRTHGGALFARPQQIRFEFQQQRDCHRTQKQAIATAVAALVEPGTTLAIDTGTTTLEVARALAGIPKLRVVTSSLAIAAALFGRDNIDLVLLGGSVRASSPDLVGSITEETLERLRCDLAILGTDGADATGLYTKDPAVAGVSKAMIAGAAQCLAVADGSKFAIRPFMRFARWRQIGTFVTDCAPPPAIRRALKLAQVTLVVAPSGKPRSAASRE